MGRKYLFRFNSRNGTLYNIYISKDGYSGSVIQRPLGRAPVLKRQKNGPISGTSLELYAECHVDGEFAELYTSDPKEYQVDVYHGSTLIWTGFVSTELYSEPSIAPPYDVRIVATDGLGELKLNNYSALGEVSLGALLNNILTNTGSSRDIIFVTNLYSNTYPMLPTRGDIPNWRIDLDFLEGKSCYDVLTQLINSLHCVITLYSNRWLIIRENDIAPLLDQYGSLACAIYHPSTDTYENGYISQPFSSIGQMGVADLWPVGNYSMSVEPARKSVCITAPYHVKPSFVNDPTMLSSSVWQSNYTIRSIPVGDIVSGEIAKVSQRGFALPFETLGNNYGYLYQDFLAVAITSDLSFKVRYAFYKRNSHDTLGARVVQVRVAFRINGGDTYYGTTDGWTKTLGNLYEWIGNSGNSILTSQLTDVGEDEEIGKEVEVNVPYSGDVPTGEGILTIYVGGAQVYISSVYAMPLCPKGYKDTIHINNGARGEGDEVIIVGGRFTPEYPDILAAYQGLWKYPYGAASAYLTVFSDSHNNNKDYMSLTALDVALSAAEHRERVEGTFEVPSSLTRIPLMIAEGSTHLLVEEWEWNLREDESKIKALSLPAVSLSVQSEVIEPIPNDTPTASSGGSSGGGGGGGTGTVTSVALAVPTGFAVSGSPITSSGTLTITFASGYSLPTTAKQNNWDKAYNAKHSHSNKSTLDAITSQKVTNWDGAATGVASLGTQVSALAQEVAQLDAGVSLVAPRVSKSTHYYISEAGIDYILIEHPLFDAGVGAEAVLMRWSRRSRRHRTILDTRIGWGEARGKLATNAPFTSTNGGAATLHGAKEFVLINIQRFILQHYLCGYGWNVADVRALSYSAFHNYTHSAKYFAFGSYEPRSQVPLSIFKEHTKESALFGFAVRYVNPEFTAAASANPAETTRMIKVAQTGGGYKWVPRYIYSEVTPFRVHCNEDYQGYWALGIQMNVDDAPHN